MITVCPLPFLHAYLRIWASIANECYSFVIFQWGSGHGHPVLPFWIRTSRCSLPFLIYLHPKPMVVFYVTNLLTITAAHNTQ